ncbi:MAG: nucleotidyltransferase substrate binding protein [Trichlorobacter sp.]|uniref:HI0074 family nucleotidyltransferase substrate-binding subunit n=1 Tax=Trichlorobacter sp. TaxID=2911007 RepID=UPI0025616E61|nr:HI0074 family nucleotidyltransferase substrate-binding subunit [Trichlorobacter sp.]MDK9718514.1 nucleotidyltransferase substrate binding protein [Trichlorobacter sp.]
MVLDYSSLANAISQLEKSINFATSDMARNDADLFEQLRNSVIQCFEFTYELSWKMLKRHLEAVSATPEELDNSSFQNLIRLGNEKGLLRSDWSRWKAYRQARTDSSHTYDSSKAEAVYAIAPDFLEEARYLYQQLTVGNTPA